MINRRDMFLGLGAVMAAASIPIPMLAQLPDNEIKAYLNRVRIELMDKIMYPPCILHESGATEVMSTQVQQEALRHVVALIQEFTP